MPRYVCIHGHFYQPPRENPWLEAVEIQETAAPWHDWNSRINAECYARNAASRIMNSDGNIAKICNNYARMSFNMGPTLLSWMEENDPMTYRAIIEADAEGRKRFSGHGPAIAQVYNHIIMPLANDRDRRTQVLWGIEDFKKRFGRRPEGMWLAETAVNTDTLEILAENGILFTILSPYQAAEIRPVGGAQWEDVRGGKVNTTRAYKCSLPSGKSISVFFYDGVLSQKIAFEGLLNNGEHFARQLIDAHPDNGLPILSHVATDGESYGHHHDHGDMALAYCLETIDNSSEAQITIYGEYLSFYPPEYEVKIIENSSWSCSHGVERWRSDCGCSAGTPGYHQRWRAPLRDALNDLRDKLADIFETEASKLLKDPWRARDEYIKVILDREKTHVNDWIAEHAARSLGAEERIHALQLLEMQRMSLLMFTSCGWFFDDISRIEAVQIMRYAMRATELAGMTSGAKLEAKFLKMLESAESNVPELHDGARVYDLLARSAHIDIPRLAAYYGIMSLLENSSHSLYDSCWKLDGTVTVLDNSVSKSEKFSAGTVRVRSLITGREGTFLFAANYRGGVSLLCGVVPADDVRELTRQETEELRGLFVSDDDEALVRRFEYRLYSLRHLPQNEQHMLLDELLRRDMQRLQNSLAGTVSDYDSLLDYLGTIGTRPPEIMASAVGLVISLYATGELAVQRPDIAELRRRIGSAIKQCIELNDERICFAFSSWLKNRMHELCAEPAETELITCIADMLKLFTEEFKWHISLYEAQNIYSDMLRRRGPELRSMPSADKKALTELGRMLRFSNEMLTSAGLAAKG